MTLATIAAPPDSNSSLLLLSSKLCRAIKIRELTILGITTAFPSPGSLLFIFSSPFWRQFGWGSLWSPSDVSDDAGVEISPPGTVTSRLALTSYGRKTGMCEMYVQFAAKIK